MKDIQEFLEQLHDKAREAGYAFNNHRSCFHLVLIDSDGSIKSRFDDSIKGFPDYWDVYFDIEDAALSMEEIKEKYGQKGMKHRAYLKMVEEEIKQRDQQLNEQAERARYEQLKAKYDPQ